MFLFDDFDFYKNKSCRSSQYITQLWDNYIQDDLLLHMGMRKNIMVSIFLDCDNLFFTITSDYEVIFSKNITVKINHIISTFEDLSTTIDISFKKSDTLQIDYGLCSYFFDKDNSKDEGTVEVECFVKCNMQNYHEFKTNLLSNLAREYQYSIQKNALGEDINKIIACHTDSEFEVFSIYMKLKNCLLDEAIKDLKEDCKLTNIDIQCIKKIYKITSEGKNGKIKRNV